MKRARTAALCAAFAALACACARAACATSAGNPPVNIPQLVAPDLFRGFEPIPPDPFGISPRGQHLVFQDGNNLVVARTFNDRVVFNERVFDPATLSVVTGFDPADTTLFLTQANSSGDFRARAVDLTEGVTLFDRHFQTLPEIRTNSDATANVVLVRDDLRTAVTIFNAAGRVTVRRSYDALAQVALNVFRPVVAVLSPSFGDVTRLEVYNGATGQPTFRDTLRGAYDAGFEPFGTAFVSAQATSSGTCKVKMVRALTGRILVSRSFNGSPRTGFTADGSLLGVEPFGGVGGSQVFLFSTRTGELLFNPRPN